MAFLKKGIKDQLFYYAWFKSIIFLLQVSQGIQLVVLFV